ncbi:MAG: hypothetical protein O3A00_26360 [Planctomycetota bacterium]|nr:hypothetical protein [Planctomycetota bacterium]
MMRYVERNPLRAGLCEFAEEWQWGSADVRRKKDPPRWLVDPSEPCLPRQWRSFVNKPQMDAEVVAIRKCIKRGSPFGNGVWVKSSPARIRKLIPKSLRVIMSVLSNGTQTLPETLPESLRKGGNCELDHLLVE